MKIILKIIISMHVFNIFCQENKLNQAIKALMVVKAHSEQFEANQQLCYLPSSIIKILNLQDDNHIADLNIIKNAIATTLPNLQDSEQINSLKIYLDQIGSGIFLITNDNTLITNDNTMRTCICQQTPTYPSTIYNPTQNGKQCSKVTFFNNYRYSPCIKPTSATTS